MGYNPGLQDLGFLVCKPKNTTVTEKCGSEPAKILAKPVSEPEIFVKANVDNIIFEQATISDTLMRTRVFFTGEPVDVPSI